MRTHLRILSVPIVLALAALPAEGQGEHAHAAGSAMGGLGEVVFPTSGSAQAQAAFIRGVALMHSFEYPAAKTAFEEAQRLEPAFAMAYWGEAMTYNHPIWMEQDSAAARAALARLGATPRERAVKAPTERERDWLAALEVLYGPGSKPSRDSAYAGAMQRVFEKYPDDPEAAVFYALALLGTAHGGRHVPTYMRAAALMEEVFRDHPRHPGAAHFLIHAYDDPTHAPLGLRAARAYSRIAPGAAHAQHMTSHIFIALGMWDDMVRANEVAQGVVNEARAARGQPATWCGHYAFWLEYGYLQQGRDAEALRILRDCHAEASAPGASMPVVRSFVSMRSRYLLDTEDWGGPAAELFARTASDNVARLQDAYAAAFAFLRDGEIEGGIVLAEEVTRLREVIIADPGAARVGVSYPDVSRVLAQQLSSLLYLADGRPDEAVALLTLSAELEERIPFEFGPPFIDKPTRELLGEVLLGLGRPAEARAAFEAALRQAPLRVQSLRGLAMAHERAGDLARAGEVRAMITEIQRPASAQAAVR
ncbi:MAG TPA: tetratricopeptide repeat protein [Longimicrobium sp.]